MRDIEWEHNQCQCWPLPLIRTWPFFTWQNLYSKYDKGNRWITRSLTQKTHMDGDSRKHHGSKEGPAPTLLNHTCKEMRLFTIKKTVIVPSLWEPWRAHGPVEYCVLISFARFQAVLQFCLCLRGIYQTSKQNLMEGELSPKLVAGNACSLDARKHTGRREMVGRQKPSLPSGVSFGENGAIWPLKAVRLLSPTPWTTTKW